MSDPAFSHLDAEGTARMVDVGHKTVQRRRAVAAGFVRLQTSTLEALRAQALPKGDVLTVARVAAILAAKKTSELIPLCHGLPLENVEVDFEVQGDGIAICATAVTSAKTGVEMEALTAVSVAALTIYDMCKAADKTMVIENVRLLEKIKE